MGRIFKIYNEATGQWDVAASGNLAGISVTDPRLLEEGEINKPANDILVGLKQQLEEQARNIAWLAEHGGGGSGSGGGGSESVVTITNGDIVVMDGVNYLYSATTQNITLSYLITANKSNQRYQISLSLDGTTIIANQEAFSGMVGTLVIPQLDRYSSSNSHSIVVTAVDPEGFSAQSYLLTIVESSINLSCSTRTNVATIGVAYNFEYTVNSKVIGEEVTLSVTNVTNGITKTYDLGVTTSTTPKLRNVSLWDLGNISVGSSYTIQAQAITSMSGQQIYSEVTTNRVVVEDGENLVVLINGIATEEDLEMGSERTEFSHGGNISFGFTPYLAGINLFYYAVRLEHEGVVREIGEFDPDLSNGNPNSYVQRDQQQIFSYPIPDDNEALGDWDITLRCWSEKGAPVKDIRLYATVIPSDHSLIEDPDPENRRYASWNIKQENFPQSATASEWTSFENRYTPPGAEEPESATATMRVYNTNGALSGFLTENGQSKLRLAGEAYGIIEVEPFSAEGTDLANWSRQGFTFSTTFKTDKHPFSDRTVFFIGNYSSDGTFSEGIKIGLEDIIWSYTDGGIKENISCRIQQNVINTVDFVVYKEEVGGEVKIFINGVLNAAREIKNDFAWKTDSQIYLGCDVNSNGYKQNFSDVEFYDIRLFRAPLSDKEIVINSLNAKARASLLVDGTVDFTTYNSNKLKNFFSISSNTPSSTLWDDMEQTYAKINFASLTGDSTRRLPLPIMLVNCENTGFTRSVYEAIGANKTWYQGCTMQYFDPNSGKTSAESTTNMSIQIQGTSSTGYRSKNLEIRFDKKLDDKYGGGQELFQPQKHWLPENQFTLKADVVDSAHANNASIGKWINDNADSLFDKTPPMEQLESNRPVDTFNSSEKHTDVTIKHTLEGFPIILLIQFDGETSQEMLGIYSFNLGRGAYYNMGFRFFKDFSTKLVSTTTGEYLDNQLPAFVTAYHNYEQTELFGTIDQRQVYSYEFSRNENLISTGAGTYQPTALFWQDDLSIIQHVGEFKYNGANWLAPDTNVTDLPVWRALQGLFKPLAEMTGSAVQKYTWDSVKGGYVIQDDSYPAQSNWSTAAAELNDRLNIRNAYSYFMVCVAFGLVDNLGKNMTLRSWNVGNGNKWWPCFYDMDTATGVDNTGLESVGKTSYIDSFYNNTSETGINTLQVETNSPEGGYDTYSARLWDVLRDSRFINTGIYTGSYDQIWDLWRNNSNLLQDANTFVNNYFSYQTAACGELLFNYDYKVKYLTKYIGEGNTSESYANIEFLHGTRVEFVRDWLKKRYYFFDGVFNYSNSSYIVPYNNKGAFNCGGAEDANPELIVKCNAPMIFTVNIGQVSDLRYFVNENTPTRVVLTPISSFNTQITINAISEINELGGLKNMRFQRFMTSMKLPGFSELDLSGVNTLAKQDPVPFDTVFINNENFSDVRHIDLSNCSFWTGDNADSANFSVDVQKYTKLKDINISNSSVTGLRLPNASLSSLNITDSGITTINISNQPFLEEINFSGCKKLKTIEISGCSKIKNLKVSELVDLEEITISSCPALTTIVCTSNQALRTFSLSNVSAVTSVDLSECDNPNLKIYLAGANNLVSLDLSGTNTTHTVELPATLNSLRTLNLTGSSIKSFQYGNNPVATYKDEVVLDLSPLSLTSFTIKDNISVTYIKFDNNPNSPFNIGASFFEGCTGLTRIFGHIRLTGSSVFKGCTNYFIHDFPEDEITPIPTQTWFGADTSTAQGKTDWENNINLDSNITLNSTLTSLGSTFRETACNLYDVYYMLKMAQNITSLTYTFYGCTQLGSQVTIKNSWNRNMFANCGKATSLSYCFYGTGNWVSIMYSPTRNSEGEITQYNGLLSPLVSVKNSGLDRAFQTSGAKKYLDDYFFSKQANGEDLKLTTLNRVFDDAGSSVTFIKDASKTYEEVPGEEEYAYASSTRLLSSLPGLTSMYSMFNGTRINFETETIENENNEEIEYSTLFYNNPALLTVTISFRNLTAKGSLIRLFGGDAVFDNDTHHFPQKLTGIFNSFTVASGTVDWPIHNSMFRKIAGTLESITGSATGNASYNSSGSFYGLNKYFMAEDPSEIFPYEVFYSCSKLKECPGFFSYLDLKGASLELPGDIFKNCTALTNFSYGFYQLKNGTYRLTGKGFLKCKLVNVDRIFAEASATYIKEGPVPYGLFRMEQTTNHSATGWNSADAATLGITEDFGIDDQGNLIPDEELTVPVPKSNSFTRNVRRNTLTNMSYALNYFQSQNAEAYQMDFGQLTPDDYGDLLIPNENYNPVEYILNSNYSPDEFLEDGETLNPNRDIRRIIKNPSYSPYKLMWNYWMVDGSYGLTNMIEGSELYDAVKQGAISAPVDLPGRFTDENDRIQGTSDSANRNITKYILPPDIFRYCVNASGTNVKYLLAYSGREESVGSYTDYGIRGRLCPFIFEPISAVSSLEGMFINCKLLNPYAYNTTDPRTDGKMFADTQFSVMGNALTDISYMFQQTMMPQNVVLPSSLFASNRNLQNLKGTWMACHFQGIVSQSAQVPAGIFDNNNNITNLQRVFSADTDTATYTGRSPRRVSAWFTAAKHKNITNVSYFLANATNSEGTVPEFWEWLNLTSANRTQPFYKMSKAKVTNSTKITGDWASGMTE